jgi:hypothetical protein
MNELMWVSSCFYVNMESMSIGVGVLEYNGALELHH